MLGLLVSHAASSGLRRWAFYLSRRLRRGREELETSLSRLQNGPCIAHRSEAKERLKKGYVAASVRLTDSERDCTTPLWTAKKAGAAVAAGE